jgi:hypothetical protein
MLVRDIDRVCETRFPGLSCVKRAHLNFLGHGYRAEWAGLVEARTARPDGALSNFQSESQTRHQKHTPARSCAVARPIPTLTFRILGMGLSSLLS